MYKAVKRFLDILFSLLLFPVLAILCIVIGILIKREDKGNLLYISKRIGRNGKTFDMYKFRTMKMDAPDLRMADGSTFNSEDDERVTKVGRVLRKTSLDEVPQIINILKGEMSFIGPRPDSAMWLDNYTEQEKVILSEKPGITGYNQVVNRNNATTKEKLRNDIYYVQNQCFKLDFWIFIQTIKNVVRKKNVYRNQERVEKQ
ncbi:sugar transferase [Christensenella intestinihominis]|uniref:sugar transferase n=1 Tax=Christensenella intestinihominis TaxID=1851429 RepID=UPI00082B7789|nr:sugar transferase [Christensenella intestinihominis]